MRYKAPYTLKKKTLPSGTVVIYYRVYVDGVRKEYSTGCSTKSQAHFYCDSLLKKGELVPKSRDDLSFAEYAKPWFIPGTCSYLKARELGGAKIGLSHANGQRAILQRHLVPAFGTMKLHSIGPKAIEEWLYSLREKGLKPITVKHFFSTIRLMLGEAFRHGLLSENPADKVRHLDQTVREKGILTQREAVDLLSPEGYEKYWDGNILGYLASLLAASTGMRLGEIVGLRWDRLKDGYVLVDSSWERGIGLKGTKTGDVRKIPISSQFKEQLENSLGGLSKEYVFSLGEKPVTDKVLTDAFRKALDTFGIDRAGRNISFHSWRHFMNTMMREKGISDSKIRFLTGHRTEKMQDHYSHFSEKELGEVLGFQKSLVIIDQNLYVKEETR